MAGRSRIWQLLAAAYLDCIARHQAAGKEGDAIRNQLPLLYGRLVCALAVQLKWDEFRYGPVEREYWKTLGSVYLTAVEAKAAQKPVLLYAGGAETTIEAEYLKVLVFHATSMDNLRPLEIEIAERFIAYFLPFFSMSRELGQESVYWVDIAKPLPPTRLAKAPEITPTGDGRVPPGINLGAQYDAETVIPVLEHLAMCWAPKPPMRSDVRRRIHAPLRVVHDLANVHRRLSGRGNATDGVESWVIDDVSLGGLGAQATISNSDWIRIGGLVGVQPNGGDNWLIGVVRRSARTGPKHAMVGIQTLSKTPRAVFADAGGLYTEALLLDVPEVGEYARMALPANALEDKVALTSASTTRMPAFTLARPW